jgi:heptosyltransferase II
MSQVLVVAPSWIGDAVLSHPMLVRLKARDPQGAIDVLAPPWVLPVYGRMPQVRNAFSLPFGHGDVKLGERKKFAKTLPSYDQAIVLPNSWKSALIPWHAGIGKRTGYVGEMRYGLVNDARTLDERQVPLMVERFAALAEASGAMPERPVPEPRLAVDAQARSVTLAKFGLATDRPVVAMAPGAEYGPAKRWPAAHFAESARLLNARGFDIWLFGSAKDVPITTEIVSLSGGIATDLAGRTSLDEAIDLLSLASKVVSNDSGLMHVAAALDRPMAALFGSSSPGFTPPLSAKARVVTLHLSCSPCFKRVCPLGHTNCLVQLEPEMVIAALD